MLNKLKGPLTAAMVSSLALVPAATVAYVATADIAVAKSDKAGGGGKGASQRALKSQAGTKGKSGTRSASSGGSKSRGHGGLDKFINKLTGKDRAGSAKVRSAGTATKPQDDPMHASNLGNMNGALHANENAIAAHIRNGNTNGPVGLMAAYVVSRSTTASALEGLGEGAGDYIQLNDQLIAGGYVDEDGKPDLDAYLESGDVNPEIDSTLGRISWSDQDKLLVENGYVDEDGNPDYQAYLDSGVVNEDIDGASTDPGAFDEDLYAGVAEADGDLTAEETAAQALIDYWNKKDTAPAETEEELRAALEARAMELEATGVVSDALPEPEVEEIEDVTSCDPEATECGAEEELASTE